ncbi:MAG: hypothetical protein ACE5IR_10965 [bacterium]
MKLNHKQKESVAKYLYDISKGFLIAGTVGMLTNKLSAWAFIAHMVAASYAFVSALVLEKER